MGSIRYDDNVVKVILAGDCGQAVHLLVRVGGSSLGDNAAKRNAVGKEVVAADAALRIAGVLVAATTERNHQRGDLLAIEIDGMVETRVKHRRGAARVLCGTKDSDGI